MKYALVAHDDTYAAYTYYEGVRTLTYDPYIVELFDTLEDAAIALEADKRFVGIEPVVDEQEFRSRKVMTW